MNNLLVADQMLKFLSEQKLDSSVAKPGCFRSCRKASVFSNDKGVWNG
jgi:hypothetical protein